MSRGSSHGKEIAGLDKLIEEITVDAYGADEQLWAFRQVLEDAVPLPADGFVIGEPVSVLRIDYDGNERLGLRARCRREDGSEHVIAASDVVFPEGSSGARYIAAYRKWLGLDPYPSEIPAPPRKRRRPNAMADDFDLSKSVELIVLSVKKRVARCRPPGSDRVVTVRVSRVWGMAPGEIVTIKPRKQWRYAGHPYLSGEIESTRLDVAALGLVPLGLQSMGIWDPKEHYWGEEGEPIEEWTRPIIAWGPRPDFEMEQVLPGEDAEDPFSDPIMEANDLKDAGDHPGACKILMELCESVPALPAWLRTLSLAARPLRRGRAHLRSDALAQPVGQPGSALPDRGCQGRNSLGRATRPIVRHAVKEENRFNLGGVYGDKSAGHWPRLAGRETAYNEINS
ncbi:MAG: cytoplasmic protein [Deltaproteobacteria bacterium]|nr:cytoplasmic protein [Deltaproteobacteria bacterium]